VLSFHIKQAMLSGRPERDLLPAGDAVYDATAVSPEFKSNSTRPHREVSFLRDASVGETLLFMKNKGVHPVRVRAGDMPNGRPWDNFDVCAHTFHVKYCSLEGLSRTSDMSRVVIQYIFHGFFEWRTKTRLKVEQKKMKSFFSFSTKNLLEEGQGSRTKWSRISPSSSHSIGGMNQPGNSSSTTVVKERSQLSTISHSRKVFETSRPVFTQWVLVL